MKKILLIATVGLFFSCQKEEIKPINSQLEGCYFDDKSRSPMVIGNGQETEGGSTGTGTITDPNSDRDENSRKKN